MFLHTYIWVNKLESSQSEILGFIKQLEFITLYLDIFTSVKSRDLNYRQFQGTIRKLYELEPKDIIIQQESNFIGNQSNYYQRTFIPWDLTVNIHASCRRIHLIL
jgi:hypothetical protein